MIDPIISLAFSIHSKKGVYALLLGSGVSRAAGIPTGWEIVLDLIRKLAKITTEDCEPFPDKWYIRKYKEEPDYSKILEYISKSATTRNQILRGYFEPNEKEREQGRKMPTQAHKSIANLVKSGFIRVIVTTNFDRLIETALEEVGIAPTVISTPDAIKGALPLTHTDCTVIKLHGDYLDTRIKNSPKELEKYSRQLDKLLNIIFDEYGLVVCGWSAEWDTALREAVQRCKSHRFQAFWTMRGEQGDKTKKLIQLRRAEEIKIKDADTFFKELEEKVLALQEFDRPHPLSVKAAVVTLKKYLRDESKDIYLHDMVMEEVEKLYQKLSPVNFTGKTYPNQNELLKRMKLYDSYTETLLAIIINGCYWGKETHAHLWVKCLERVANASVEEEVYEIWNRLRFYPALLLLYGGGISSIFVERYSTFSGLLYKPKVSIERQERSALYCLNIYKQSDSGLGLY
jgi:phosphoglycolate phosphatase-like HAD superfamily hydrolase